MNKRHFLAIVGSIIAAPLVKAMTSQPKTCTRSFPLNEAAWRRAIKKGAIDGNPPRSRAQEWLVQPIGWAPIIFTKG